MGVPDKTRVWGCDVDAGLSEGVTDAGLHALVQAGCGLKLRTLSLRGKEFASFSFPVQQLCEEILWSCTATLAVF